MARVLASGADLLLLDEPTNHLDLETVAWLENWLRTGRRSYILVTHDRDEAFELAEDNARENVRYVEVRYAPILHQEEGMGLERIA